MKTIVDVFLWGLTISLLALALVLVGASLWGPDGGAFGAFQSWQRERVITRTVRKHWSQLIDEGGRLGAADANAVIVEFGDYACPACQLAYDSVRSLISSADGSMAVAYRHSPPSASSPGGMAARASICAEEFGLFVQMHDRLVRDEQWRRFSSVTEWEEYAARIGQGAPGDWGACMQSTQTKARLARDMEFADMLGLYVRPTFVGLFGVVEGVRSTATIGGVGR